MDYSDQKYYHCPQVVVGTFVVALMVFWWMIIKVLSCSPWTSRLNRFLFLSSSRLGLISTILPPIVSDLIEILISWRFLCVILSFCSMPSLRCSGLSFGNYFFCENTVLLEVLVSRCYFIARNPFAGKFLLYSEDVSVAQTTAFAYLSGIVVSPLFFSRRSFGLSFSFFTQQFLRFKMIFIFLHYHFFRNHALFVFNHCRVSHNAKQAITLNGASSKFRNDMIEVIIATYRLKG